jgi:hypothetical protein
MNNAHLAVRTLLLFLVEVGGEPLLVAPPLDVASVKATGGTLAPLESMNLPAETTTRIPKPSGNEKNPQD